MPVPLQEFVRHILLENDRGARFHGAIHGAWGAVTDHYPQRHRWRRLGTLRAIMWEEATQRLIDLVANDPDMQVVKHRDTISFIAEDAVLFRLKRATPALVTSNYPTPEALLFDNHDLDLYGYSELQRVELCYVPDQFNSSLMWVGVAARYNGCHLWKIELDSIGAVTPPVTLPLEEKATDTAKLARLKNPANEQAERDKKQDNG